MFAIKRQKRFFAVTIDTEGDYTDGWHMLYPFRFRGITEGVRQNLTPLFQRYGIKPTYFLSHEILKDETSMDILRNLPDCELGTHLHWDDPVAYPGQNRMLRHAMQGRFSYSEEFEQMSRLTELFQEKTGYAPNSFRAGRFGVGENSCEILNRLGYHVDSSITPHISHLYKDDIYFPDFTNARETPHFTPWKGSLDSIGTSPLLEVPVSVRVRHRRIDPFGLFSKPIQIWMRPFQASLSAIVDRIRRERKSDIIVIMFHNVELVAGCSPYTKTKEDVSRYLHDLESICSEALQCGYVPVTLEEYYQSKARKRKIPPAPTV